MAQKQRKILISLSGIDGSGKTTLAKKLAQTLPETAYIHLLSFRPVNKLKRLIKPPKEGKSCPRKDQPPGILNFLNLIMLFFDIFLFKIYFLALKKQYIICDRYFYDLLISLQYRAPQMKIAETLKKSIPKPDLAFLITIDPKTAQQREEADLHDISYYEIKQQLFKEKEADYSFISIENENLETTQTTLLTHIEALRKK